MGIVAIPKENAGVSGAINGVISRKERRRARPTIEGQTVAPVVFDENGEPNSRSNYLEATTLNEIDDTETKDVCVFFPGALIVVLFCNPTSG